MAPRLFPNRIYKSGTGIQWCFFRWSSAQEPYLYRLFLFKTPWLALSLNWIMQPDSGDPHDHTSDFLSIFVYGWYDELRKVGSGPWRNVRRSTWNYVRGSDQDAHRILRTSPGGCLTLCLMGPKTREWGYHTNSGWIHYAKYAADDQSG